MKWIQGALFRGVKRQGPEVNHSPPIAEIKKGGAIYLHFPTTLHGVVLNELSN
jgi:hypothetical protein